MIGKNIQLLRKKIGLSQYEFARIIGVSRNSLSRYETGISQVSSELMDTICSKFNVSYIDIVGEEKLLTPIEEYELTMKIEILKERGANILSRLYRYHEDMEIDYADENNPWIIMSDDLGEVINTKIYLVNNFSDLERYAGYLDGIERILDIMIKGKVA